MEYGINIIKDNKSVKVERKTKECKIIVKISEEEKECKINTGINFLNHMIETISLRSGFSIDVNVEIERFSLQHVIAEDTGIAIGKAFLEIFKSKINEGIQGNGFFNAIIDEASSIVSISIEGRPGLYFDNVCEGIEKEKVEDMLSCDLKNFLSGFSLGMHSTIHINCICGKDPHHSWESIFRALGEALRITFEKNEKRKNKIVGIKGILE
ncbi:MAG: imidazoleglycerol-phosphate dehydratase [Candidatus Altarchaeaceae archaeon]